jgi:hypothetical protein
VGKCRRNKKFDLSAPDFLDLALLATYARNSSTAAPYFITTPTVAVLCGALPQR